MPVLFTSPDSWTGGSVELALELGPPDDRHVHRVFNAVWSHPDLQGVYLRADVEPDAQVRHASEQIDPLTVIARGVARLPVGVSVPCVVDVVREEGGSDWVMVSLPMGSVAAAVGPAARAFYTTGNVSGTAPPEVVRTIEDWFGDLGVWIFGHAPFRLGVIGFLVSGQETAQRVEDGGVPALREMAYLWPEADGVRYAPRNAYPPM